MSLLVVTTTFDKPERALYIGLARSGISLDLICQPDAPGQSELLENGIRISNLKIRHRLDWEAIRFIRNHLRSRMFRIIYAPRNDCLSASLIASLGKDIKIVGYRGTSGHISKGNPGDWLTYLNPRVDKIICVSDSVRHYLLRTGLPPHRLVTIYKGHEVDWYENPKKPDPVSRNIPSSAFIAGFVGNMRPDKGVEVFVHSHRHLHAPDNIGYLLAGEIRYRSLLMMSLHRDLHPNIRFTGFREDAVNLMKVFSVAVMPSIAREGFPKAIIEAMAQGIPPIVTRVGGMPEIVKNHINGLIVPPGNAPALAEAIQFLADNPDLGDRLGRNAKKTIIERFNSRIMISRTLKLFSALLDGLKMN